MNIKKNSHIVLFCVLFSFFWGAFGPVFAQGTEAVLPVSFTPKRALVGDQIALNAIVKNNESQRGVLTVDFFAGDTKIGTQAGEIEKGAEKILIVPWVMPSVDTVVSVKESSFVGADGKVKQVSKAIGSITVSPSSRREDFFSTYFEKTKRYLENKRLSWLAHVQKKREELKNSAPKMRDRIGNAIEIAERGSLSDAQYGETKDTLANQGAYYGYGILRSILASPTLFYALVIIIAAAIVKFIFGRFV